MANRFWVGGTATWDATAGTKWSTTSGGAGGSAVPTTSDAVFFDAASGAVTVSAGSGSPSAGSIDFTGFTGTFTIGGAVTLTCAGSVTLTSGMTWTQNASGTLSITGTGSITSAGKAMSNLTINGVGITVTPVDNLSALTLTVSSGTLNCSTNNPNVTASTFASNNSIARTVSLGSGLWTLTSTGTVWNLATVTNLTFNKNSATIKVTDATSAAKTFSGGGLTYNDVWFSGEGSLTLAGANTFADFKVDGGNVTVNFPAATTTTVSSLTIAGSAGASTLLMSSALGSQGTISDASGTNNLAYCAIRDLSFTGGATFNARKSYDMSNNAGINFANDNGLQQIDEGLAA